jgi:hypothetical protein
MESQDDIQNDSETFDDDNKCSFSVGSMKEKQEIALGLR